MSERPEPERASLREMDQIWNGTYEGPAGDCPLPEPGRSTRSTDTGLENDPSPIIEHSGHMTIQAQPRNFDYDADIRNDERTGYIEALKAMLERGEISQAEFDQFSQLEP